MMILPGFAIFLACLAIRFGLGLKTSNGWQNNPDTGINFLDFRFLRYKGA
jgi:hypothetical protein